MTDFDWEPSYGFCASNVSANEVLAETLEGLRRQVCAYGRGMNGVSMCDCKYGRGVDSNPFSEQTGCPELTELINRLLHRPATFGMGPDAVQQAKDRGYDLAVSQMQAALEQMQDIHNFARTL